MNITEKQDIQKALIAFIGRYESQAKACASLRDVSEATIINMKSGKWDNISDGKWRTVAKQIGMDNQLSRFVETMDFNTLILYFDLAREEGATFAITAPAGYGKTFTGKWYADSMKGKPVYYLQCASYWNKKYFLVELGKAMGINYRGMSVYDLMENIISELRTQDQPLIILDEIDKLKDEVLLFFITFYNELNGLCGIVWTSTDAIKRRIEKGIRLNKMGYEEVYRRIGRRFIPLSGTNQQEVEELCEMYGINGAEEINRIRNEYQGDISRIDREHLKKKAIGKFESTRSKRA
ncbi:ATP-binding protein [Chitinophaga agrisoli]|uniref:ATP-binding protein n=1 Tax=Chitinophaga agrisoli TaxID=2607653 RepID=A0A5B2W1I2_9BACT|nr:AAA family ATPase [Chitinophaga agrisoli]KAA2245521.1 ATP-binding protein [Chitinophaga agrisoli]